MKTDFFELMGVAEDSPLIPLFDALYADLQRSMRPIEEFFQQSEPPVNSVEEGLNKLFANKVVLRILEAKKAEQAVLIGDLSNSADDTVEAFFCSDSFEVENDQIYFNALKCAH